MTPPPDRGARPLAAILRDVSVQLAEAGLSDPRREARSLVRAITRLSAEAALRDPNQPVSVADQAAIADAAARRSAGTPLSRIVGRREFWGLDFALSDATLDPRPDTETLVEAVAARFPDRDRPLSILDLGTGSGCLAVALLSDYVNACAVAVDRSEKALRTATANAEAHGVARRFQALCGRWADAIDRDFDLVISNPPYIRSDEIGGLAPEVRLHDPPVALDGGEDGMDAYRDIAAGFARLVKPGGWMILEAGAGMAGSITGLFAEPAEFAADLSGIVRAVAVRRLAEKAHFEYVPKKGLGMSGRSG